MYDRGQVKLRDGTRGEAAFTYVCDDSNHLHRANSLIVRLLHMQADRIRAIRIVWPQTTSQSIVDYHYGWRTRNIVARGKLASAFEWDSQGTKVGRCDALQHRIG